MKRGAALAVLVFLLPVLQTGLALFVPDALRPDLSLLTVLGLALCWRNTATGLVMTAAVGFTVDLFSGGLLGQHALLYLVAFLAARTLSLHVNLVGAIPQMCFAAGLTVVTMLGLIGLTSFFTAGSAGSWQLDALGLHALVNAFAAPFVTAIVGVMTAWIGGEEGARRTLRLEPRGWAA
ncbi:MAG: rod shape-determining protein MreD [Myxococcota bacterium]